MDKQNDGQERCAPKNPGQTAGVIPVSNHVHVNETRIRALCQNCDDIIIRPMRLGREGTVEALIVYIEAAVSNMMLEDSVIGKLVNVLWQIPDSEVEAFVRRDGCGISDTAEYDDMQKACQSLLAGNAVFFLEGYDKAVKIGSKGYPNMGVQKAESEKVLRGSKEGFSDSVKTNTALIRKRIRSTRLKVEEIHVGKHTDTVVALVYMEDLLYPSVKDLLKERIEAYEIDAIFDSGMIEQLTEENWCSPFPQFESTERPDLAAMEIMNGRLVVICDNTPYVLLLPTTLASFFQVSEDRYRKFWFTSCARLIRYVAMVLALTISGVYLSVICFHTQILPTHLLLAFAEARKGVPFPSIIEILLMELSFELIREAGVRMPGPLSGTIGIVGGLIIGDAAVSANMVSPMSVVVVALSALASFAIPKEEFQAPIRLLKYGFILLGGMFGITGIVCGLFLLCGHLARLESFGIPYLMPYVGQQLAGYEDERDGILRAPFRRMKVRPVFARRQERVRLRKKGESHVRR